jgi:hypothetical protein
MTSLDRRLVPKVQALIAKYGKTVTVTVPGLRSYSVADGTVCAAGDTDYSVKITPPTPWTMAPLPGSSVQSGDMSAYVAASGLEFTPDAGMVLTDGGQAWTVMAVGRIYTGDLVAMYLLQLRA